MQGLAVACIISGIQAEPIIPRDPSFELGRSRHRTVGGEPVVSTSWRESRKAWEADPERLTTAIGYIRENLVCYRRLSDPRYLGYAGAVLGRYQDNIRSSSELLLLRATLKQSLHDFGGAEKDLDMALQLDPGNGEAWLTRSITLQVQGRYEEARRVQWNVFRTCPGILSTTSAAQLASLTGKSGEGLSLLAPLLKPENPNSFWEMV